MPAPTRLQVLRHAREIAEKVGAVQDGGNYFEARNGERYGVEASRVRLGHVAPEKLCGVCIAGALFLAEMELGLDPYHPSELLGDIEPVAETLANEVHDRLVDKYEAVTNVITDRGTPYVLAVLDRMIEHERAAVA